MLVKTCIKNARYKLGMSQVEFAEFLGINKASVNMYEQGKRNPSFKVIRKMVDKLKTKGIDLEYKDLRDDWVNV